MTAKRRGAIALGILLMGASALWLLFWAVVAMWMATDDSGTVAAWLFVAATLAGGMVALAVGIFLVAGWFPGRTGWIVVALVAALPIVPAIAEGLASEDHVASVTAGAIEAYGTQRGGSGEVAATCTWEDDDDHSETWRCVVTAASRSDVCFFETSRQDPGQVSTDRCESDDAQVARAVESVYRAQRGRSAAIRYCFGGDAGLWRCNLWRAPDRYCFVEAAWRAGGRLETQISACEREVLRAVSVAYRRRSGRQGIATVCVEDEQNRGVWSCRVRSAAVRDTCIVTFGPLASNVSATVGYCERELADAVERLFARVYEKRTDARDARAECRVEDREWTCDVTYSSGRRDRCEVAIERRAAGPKVVYWATSCASGRL
jgi:hypothetical protein